MTTRELVRRAGSNLGPVGLAFAVAILLLLVVDAPPLTTLRLLWDGSFGSTDKIGDTLMAWAPLALASAGLVITFAAGLWNIGIEGQIVMGAIAATWAAREVPGPSAVLIPVTLAAGIIGGILWALIVGVLRTHAKVNEIFGGLGLDFVATGLVIYLIIGPWKRPGIASTSGTDIFRSEAWLPTFGTSRLSPLAVALAVAGVIFAYFLMRGTLFGLRLRAVGKNQQSAFLMGIPTNRYMLGAFALCGALAGIAGAIQATGFHHKLVPAISGGYGFLGILVVLLAAFRAIWIAPIALFFVMISVGSTQLQLRLDLDSALGGVLQGVLVLFVVLGGGWQVWRARRSTPVTTAEE
ncbi:MAG: ABC transporter permease [Acidimicrobiia bacterium]